MDELAKELAEYKNLSDLRVKELEKLPLLNAFIHEAMRIYPPIPAPIGRVCPPQGTILGGYYIPGGVTSMPIASLMFRSSYVIEALGVCRDPLLFPDPESFKPER